jgi:MFS family permease
VATRLQPAAAGPRSAAASETGRLAALDALREPKFRLLWIAGLFINSARWLDFLVLTWLALELTGSPFMVGLAAFFRSAPMMVLGLFAGLLADRLPRGRLLVAVQCLNLGASLALALVFGTGHGSFEWLIAMQTLLGVAWVLDFPSRRTVLFTLVGQGRLTNAVSLESTSMQGTKMVGPLLGGLLLARIGPAGCYLVLGLFYVVALVLLVVLVRRIRLPSAGSAETVLAGLVTGLREVRAQPIILAVLAITFLMNLFVFPYQHMWSVLARDILHVGPELLGLLVAADGLGALIGSLWIASRRGFTSHTRVYLGGSLAAAGLVVALALSPWYALSLVVQFLLGFAESGFGTMQAALILLHAPERARGRAMGILTVCIGTGPLGALWIGFAASQAGAPLATAAGGLIGLLLMIPIAVRMTARPR